jgi:hypothetical protein
MHTAIRQLMHGLTVADYDAVHGLHDVFPPISEVFGFYFFGAWRWEIL